MKKSISLLWMFTLVLFGSAAMAQGELKFEKEAHDFGSVSEGTNAVYEFKFKNTGNQPVVISHVQASCGCTTPDWSKDPVLPGKTGFVKAAYSSAGRPGAFNKTITVTSNAATPSKVLTIKGVVEDKPIVYSAEELAKSPKLVLEKSEHQFGTMEMGQKRTAKFTVKNTGKTDLEITGIKAPCQCVDFKTSEAKIKPGKSATLELTYAPSMLTDRTETVTLVSNDITNKDIKVALKAKVVQSLTTPNMLKESSSAVPFK